jgi:hypothetical protein
MPFYGTVLYFLVFLQGENTYQIQLILIYIFAGTVLIPILFLWILKYFKLIKTFQIPNIQERRLPLLFMLFISFIATKILSSYRVLPDLTIMFIGITFITLIAYFLISFRFKISLHAISIGGTIGVVLALSKLYNMNLLVLVSFLFLLTGIILASRLKLKAHTNFEIYTGFFVGIFTQYGIFLYYSI